MARQQPERFARDVVKRLALNYLLYLPDAYAQDPTREWPLILFLHGSGERGDDLELVKRHGLPRIVEARPDFPFIVVSPQCPSQSNWTEQLEALLALLDHVLASQRVDRSRVYLTGLSMGGFGTWALARRAPDRFAALAPICGGGDPHRLQVLKAIPVWAFHGSQDDVVPLSSTVNMVEALRRLGGNVKLTVYPDANHDAWTETYDNPELYRWFLSHRRPAAAGA